MVDVRDGFLLSVGVNPDGLDPCGQTEAAAGEAQHLDLEHGVQEGHPVLVPHEMTILTVVGRRQYAL